MKTGYYFAELLTLKSKPVEIAYWDATKSMWYVLGRIASKNEVRGVKKIDVDLLRLWIGPGG